MDTKSYLLPVAALALVTAACGGPTPTAEPSRSASSTPATSDLTPPATGAAGATVWVKRYAGGRQPAVAESVVTSPDGASVFVTGSNGTVAYRAGTGERRWLAPTDAFVGSGGSTPPPTVTVSPDGATVFVAGTTGGAGSGEDYVTFAFDAATGAQLWGERYDGPANGADGARSVAVSPDGGTVFVHGVSEGTASGPDYATVAYNASTGARVWVARYDGPGHGPETYFPSSAPQSLAVTGARVFVTGTSEGAESGPDYATIAYNASTGARVWVSRYNGPGDDADLAHAVTVSPGGETVFVTGGSSGATSLDGATVAYNAATGEQRWASRYDGPAKQNEGGIAIAVDSSGTRVFVTGTSEGPGPGKEDYATLGYDAATGAQLWVNRFNGAADSDDNPASLALGPDGAKVYVTGWSSRGEESGNAYATVAYDTTDGAQLWATLYDGLRAGYDEARSVAVSPNGDLVFVTGTADDGYATVAYRG